MAPFLVALLFGGAMAAAPENVTVGLLLRRTTSSGELIETGLGQACAALLAIRDANERDGSVVAEFARVGPSAPWLDMIARDTRDNDVDGLRAYRQLRDAGARILIGPGRSSVSNVLAVSGSIDELVLVSPSASASELSHGRPFFFRTYPPDPSPARGICALIREYGWQHFSILHFSSTFGRSVAQSTTLAAADFGLIISRDISFASAQTDEIETAVAQLACLGNDATALPCPLPVAADLQPPSNIVLLVCFAEHLPAIVEAATRRGILGTGSAWFLYVLPTLPSLNALISALPPLEAEILSRSLVGVQNIEPGVTALTPGCEARRASLSPFIARR